jgi:hypothetical protein
MRKILVILAGLALPLAENAVAQRTFSSGNTPIIVTESAQENFEEPKVAKKPAYTPKTSVKLNPLLILSGDMPLYIEQKIADKITFEVSAGLTYDNFTTAFDLDHYSEGDTRQNEMGYSYAGGLRYYPSDSYNTMEGYYFAPEFRHRVYNSTFTQVQGTNIDPVKHQRTITDMKLIFGYTNYFEDHIFFDAYMGVGMRDKNYKNLVRSEAYVYNGQNFDQNFSIYNDNVAKPLFALGFKLGFSF